ncbi:hypothetical protein WR25_21968 [Diploscapter pachys]|uniref:glucuronosyltransferase n=1 Tax=Diploscapter pachys TaxID=2018661 RepID=A0A2A2KMV3_9BILA|nr:hypothetical protein WR25_21968 [Diploscapter pachys]
MEWLKDEKFDIAFPHMYSLCAVGLVKAANIPTWIWLNSGVILDYIAAIIGVPLTPSYVPPMHMQSTDEMSFYERAKSFVGHTINQFYWPMNMPVTETQIFREEVDPNFPNLLDLARECPLVMTGSNILYELPRPTLAKVVHIGGIGMQFKHAKPLTGEFAEIVDKAKGIFVFSFGSVAGAHEMPQHMKHAFLDAFREFPDYHIIMRYEADDLDEVKPTNLHLYKWMPQQDLLAHNKTVAIITHGGYNTIQESLAVGVPMITMPLFADQCKNSMMAKKRGFAVYLNKGNINKETVVEAMREVIDNPEYLQNVKRMSAMVKNAPLSPEQLLIRWTEFVAEFKTLDNLVGQTDFTRQMQVIQIPADKAKDE